MLNFSRGIHITRCVLQQTSINEQGPKVVKSFLKYWRTPRDLRKLMYRRRNAAELLSSDILDPETDRRAKPQKEPHLPSKYDLRAYMNTFEGWESLKTYLTDDMAVLTKRSNSISPYVLNELLIKSAEFERLPSALIFLYSYKGIKEVKDASNLNMALTFLYLNPFKSLFNKTDRIRKAKKAFGGEKTNGITDLLEASILANKGAELKPELFTKLEKLEIRLPLKKFENVSKPSQLLEIPGSFEHLYLQCKPISLELGSNPLYKTIPAVQDVESFVTKYEEILQKVDRENRFEAIRSNSKFHQQKKEAKSEDESKAESEFEATEK